MENIANMGKLEKAMAKVESPVEVEYRSEQAFGSGERNIVDVLWYEIHELGNYDMLDDIRQRLSDPVLVEELIGYQQEMEDTGFVDDMSEDELKEFYQRCLDDINRVCQKDYKYCLWLASKDTVADYYLQNDTGNAEISAYYPSDFVLTDLGYDGRLYFYEEMPEEAFVSVVEVRKEEKEK